MVPSTYAAINGSVTLSNLFSVTEHFHPLHWHSGQHQMPGVFLAYDISGMKVTHPSPNPSPYPYPYP